jgi:glycosyltransferase involved in cell wall biosynthesis
MPPLRIASYINPRGTLNPTGAGKHVIQMLRGLADDPDVRLEIIAARDLIGPTRQMPAESGLADVPVRVCPFPARPLHLLWRHVGWPKAEAWAGDAEWLYCPSELFVPVRRLNFASTIHCVNWFDPELPWYGRPETALARRRIERIFRGIFDEAQIILTVSEFLKAGICHLFSVAPERIGIVGNGVEECFFTAGRQAQSIPQLPGEPAYLLAVAQLTERKGAGYYVALADALLRRNSKLRLKIVSGLNGDAQWIAQAGRRENIELLPYLPGEQVAVLMTQSVAVLVLSRYESFGIPAVEAMAAGAPVIAADFAALPEIVGDGGVVVNAANSEEIADLVLDLVSDPARRQALIERGSQRARHFSWRHCVSRLLGLLRSKS